MRRLKTGVTTGLCAAASSKAAMIALLSPAPAARVDVMAKNGARILFEVAETVYENDSIRCAVIKDAGDDPDVTNGVRVCAAVSKTDTGGIEIDGGDGVGRVTKPGLSVPAGRAAINPVPAEMIRAAVTEVCMAYDYTGGVRVVISIPGGADIAKATMNERLGIEGGLSILGTTGIVEPMSERAIVETIKADINVRIASGEKSLVITPGNYGRDFASEALGLNIAQAVKCSNFIGETLDYACAKEIRKLTLIGHAGKLVKLAGGIMNTHSAIADCRMEIIAAHCALAGAGAGIIGQIMACVTVEAAIGAMSRAGINGAAWKSIGERIGYHLRERTRGQVTVEYIVFTQEYGVLYRGVTA